MRFIATLALASMVLAAPAPKPQDADVTADILALPADFDMGVDAEIDPSESYDRSQAVEQTLPMINAVNAYLQAALDPLGLIAAAAETGADVAPNAAAVADAAIISASNATAAAAAFAKGYPGFLAGSYRALPRLSALTARIMTAPLRLGAKLIGGLLRAQGRILRGLGGLLNVAGVDAEAIGAFGYGANVTAAPLPLPLPLPKGLGFPTFPKGLRPKVAGFPKGLAPPVPGAYPRPAFPLFTLPKGRNGTAKGLPKLPKAPFPKGFPKFAPKGYNATAKGLPKLPKGGPLGFLGSLLEQQAARFNGTVKGVKGRPRLPKLAPKLTTPPVVAAAPPAPLPSA